MFNDDSDYILGQKEAISDLLREIGFTDANAALAPIGVGCYEVQPTDTLAVRVFSLFAATFGFDISYLATSVAGACLLARRGIIYSARPPS